MTYSRIERDYKHLPRRPDGLIFRKLTGTAVVGGVKIYVWARKMPFVSGNYKVHIDARNNARPGLESDITSSEKKVRCDYAVATTIDKDSSKGIYSITARSDEILKILNSDSLFKKAAELVKDAAKVIEDKLK